MFDTHQQDILQEQAAWSEVHRVAKEIAPALSLVWRQGDGDGGALLDALASVAGISRPNFPTEPREGRRRLAPHIRTVVMERDAYRCKRCSSHINLTIDHITPVSKGGSDDISNLQTLCAPCNSSKGAK